jgi:hypothetical protein
VVDALVAEIDLRSKKSGEKPGIKKAENDAENEFGE